MSSENENLEVVKKLLELGKKVEEYEIAEGIAIYRGAPVDYQAIKKLTYIRVSETIIENKTNPTSTTTLVNIIEGDIKKDSTKTETTTSTTKDKSLISSEEDLEIEVGFKREEVKGLIELHKRLDKIEIKEGAREAAEKIAIFFNINGTSKTRTNVLHLIKKSYTMNEIASTLQLQDKTNREKERTDRRELTVERISAAFAEETANFLKKNPMFIKIKELQHLGFTKSFFCNEVKRDKKLAAKVYKNYIYYAKTWRGGNPLRFSEKMKIYFSTYLNYSASFFAMLEMEIEQEEREKLIKIAK